MRRILAAFLLIAAVPAFADPVVTYIDVPGAGATYVGGISPSGIVAGSYAPNGDDPCGQQCGFVRTPDGTFNTFSVFATSNVGILAVTDDGTTAGAYFPKVRYTHAFIRTPDGALTDIDFRKSFTSILSINTSGAALGKVFGAKNEGLLRKPNGKIQQFQATGCTYTTPIAMNDAGTVIGSCLQSGVGVTFLRARDGETTLIEKKGWEHIGANAIDDTGAIAGGYEDTKTQTRHGYIRDAKGKFQTFDFPAQAATNIYFTGMATVGGDRQVAGYFTDSNEHMFGFIHHMGGTDDVFDVSGGHVGQGGTVISGFSPSGVVAGYYFDDALQPHGYIRTP
jgi:hypothetical protein